MSINSAKGVTHISTRVSISCVTAQHPPAAAAGTGRLRNDGAGAATIELGPLVRGLPHLRTIIASCIRIFSTGQGNCVKLILSGRYAVLPLCLSRKRGQCPVQDLEEEKYLTSLEKDKFVEGWRITIVKSTCCIPSGWEVVGTADLLRATGDSCRISTELEGIEKEVWNQANQNGAMGDLPRCR